MFYSSISAFENCLASKMLKFQDQVYFNFMIYKRISTDKTKNKAVLLTGLLY